MTKHQSRVKIVSEGYSCDSQLVKNKEDKCGTSDLESLQDKGFKVLDSGLEGILKATQSFTPTSLSPVHRGGLEEWVRGPSVKHQLFPVSIWHML